MTAPGWRIIHNATGQPVSEEMFDTEDAAASVCAGLNAKAGRNWFGARPATMLQPAGFFADDSETGLRKLVPVSELAGCIRANQQLARSLYDATEVLLHGTADEQALARELRERHGLEPS